MNPQLETDLRAWVEAGALRPLDLALTHFIGKETASQNPALLLAVALVSERSRHGHVCLDLQACLEHPQSLLTPAFTEDPAPLHQQLANWLPASTADWVRELLSSPALSDARNGTTSQTASPLVLGGTPARPLLYLRRYWQDEQSVRQGLQARLQGHYSIPETASQLIASLFPPLPEGIPQPDWQKIASVIAALSQFAIITGGPGTGKTTTVVRLLALLQGLQLLEGKQPLQIRLAAPTGKAAARLNESLGHNIAALQLDGSPLTPEQQTLCRDQLPKEVTTVHRLLGSQPGTRHFRHDATNPLGADLVVVDEASMVDLEIMARLITALPPQARLILLGDKDQLASVEAGSLLGDLCEKAEAGGYTPATQEAVLALTGEPLKDPHSGQSLTDPQGSPLQQATAMLRHSFRFDRHPGIGQLAYRVNTGRASLKELQACFDEDRQRPDPSLAFLSITEPQDSAFLSLVTRGYLPYLQTLEEQQPAAGASQEELDTWAEAVFAQHRRFQLLTALRQGNWGVEELNAGIYQALRNTATGRRLLPAGQPLWYRGRPVLVTRNDYNLQLMNGDIGICLQLPGPTPEQPGPLRVAFPDAHKGVRWLLPSRLQAVETVFAMTVHKSQGSEFNHTALLLPPHDSPVLTKELLYTGITRSSEQFSLISSNRRVLEQLLLRKVERASGLNL
ncbi:exodeoxyribonuclease V subunit alpha [Marinospirillum perlucidum]|uniref:exodeoxyribonuclease V subunit alpha n=1 Tax=Marinospirillum perlucidum TaxID=1982602 RepID=UPI000DF42A58|nr:exodeoxyribonuclease V subunit alpha [Marinospirillum perlucidum]